MNRSVGGILIPLPARLYTLRGDSGMPLDIWLQYCQQPSRFPRTLRAAGAQDCGRRHDYLILFNTIIDFRIVSSWGCAQLVHEMVDADIKAIELNALEGTRRSSIM